MSSKTIKYSLHEDPEEPSADELPQHDDPQSGTPNVKMSNERTRSHCTGSTVAILISVVVVVTLMGITTIIFWDMWGIPEAVKKNGEALQKLLSLLQDKDTSKTAPTECGEKDCSSSNGGLETLCNLKVDAGPCNGIYTRYYFDDKAGTCNPFTYSGCQGNGNNFASASDCYASCNPRGENASWHGRTLHPEVTIPGGRRRPDHNEDTCSLPYDTGNCRGMMRRWYHDAAFGECREFVYGGCDGNDNRFESLEACQDRCVDKNEGDDPCRQPKDMGRCREVMERFYYDQELGQCLAFQFGGCGGNSNNFQNLHDCQSRCEE